MGLLLLFWFGCNQPEDSLGKDSGGNTTDLKPDADSDGFSVEDGDCADDDEDIYPGATEICNGIDDNCDDTIDEGVTTQYWMDADDDGFGSAADVITSCDPPTGYVTNDNDCDDNNASNYPAAPEVCDGVDNDCDGSADEGLYAMWYQDADGDGFGDPGVATEACDAPAGFVADDTDCDDTEASSFPGNTEVCDEIDNDCDGLTDEEVTTTFYADLDGDGFGDPAAALSACAAPANYVVNNIDCDDTNADIYPGNTEVCDELDNDCDGAIDEGVTTTFYADLDGDGAGGDVITITACTAPTGYTESATDCDDLDVSAFPGNTEVCDGVDNDCDGTVDEDAIDATTWYTDSDGDGYGAPGTAVTTCDAGAGHVVNDDDCDDANAAINPSATEVCDGVDNNCDGDIDSGLGLTWYADADGDGFGDSATGVVECEAPAGYVGDATDCDDGRADVNPSAPEVCDGADNDCDGSTDEGVTSTFYADDDGDGFGDPASNITDCAAPAGYVGDATDCDDGRIDVNPSAPEVCDGADNDCDGSTDEGVTSTFYADDDGDGFGDPASNITDCAAPAGYVGDATDCNDMRADVNPAAPEVCDGADNDCDGSTDEGVTSTFYADWDGDGFGVAALPATGCSAPAGYVSDATDCDDVRADINPSATEICDLADNDCDGLIDEDMDDSDGDGTCDDVDDEECDGMDNDGDGDGDEGLFCNYTIYGSDLVNGPYVDDDLRISYNGSLMYQNFDYNATVLSPISFVGTPGDVLSFYAYDSYGVCRNITEIWLVNDDGGVATKLTDAYNAGCGFPSDPTTPFWSQSVPIPGIF